MTSDTDDSKVLVTKVNVLPKGFLRSKVHSAISALTTHAKTKTENGLFNDSSTRILMDITAFKIPSVENHFFNIILPNSPYSPDADILLIIPDDMKCSTDPENRVAHVKENLQRAEIKIREVMTLKQFKDDYSTFEAKRQLAKRIDIILSDIRVFKNLPPLLGREFYRKKKFPLHVKLDEALENFDKKIFDYAVRKSVINISNSGSTSTITVGQTNLSEEQLTDNVSKICNWLLRHYPGRWKNVAKLSLYTAFVPPLIIYLSKGTRNDVKSEIRKKRKLPPVEEDELSTMPGRRVRVHPEGKIELIKEKLDSEDEEVVRLLGVDEELKPEPKVKKELKRKKKTKLNLEDKYVDVSSKRQVFEEGNVKKKKGTQDQLTKKKKKTRKVKK